MLIVVGAVVGFVLSLSAVNAGQNWHWSDQDTQNGITVSSFGDLNAGTSNSTSTSVSAGAPQNLYQIYAKAEIEIVCQAPWLGEIDVASSWKYFTNANIKVTDLLQPSASCWVSGAHAGGDGVTKYRNYSPADEAVSVDHSGALCRNLTTWFNCP